MNPGESINGKTDNRFTAVFNPSTIGNYTVIATVYYGITNASAGNASYQADLASQKTFNFTVVA